MRSSVIELLVLALSLFATAELQAQLRGGVQDTSGQPLEGAVVEAWDDQGRIAGRLTDARGRFTFPASVAQETRFLKAGRLGYRQAVVGVRPEIRDYVIRLREAPITIPGVLVEIERPACGRGSDALARALWEAMRRQYRPGLDTLGVATYMAARDSVVPRAHVGPLDLPQENLDQRGVSRLIWYRWTRQFRARGYALSVIHVDSTHAFRSWSYPPLEAELAAHFASSQFGRLHRFVVTSEDAEGWTLFYCPRDADRAEIEGRLRLAPDTSLVWAEWRYVTSEPRQEAGGRVLFSEYASSGIQPYLLPAEGMTWRMRPDSMWSARHLRYEGWVTVPGDSVPFLPDRRNPSPNPRR